MLIYLKGCYDISGKINFVPKEPRLRFSVPLGNNPPVTVEIIPDENSVESFQEFEASTELWEVLQSDIRDVKELPEKLQTQLSEMTTDILKATQKVLSLIKYCLNQIMVKENLFYIKGQYWSIDKSQWKMIPPIISMVIDTHGLIPLNENTVNAIQSYIQDDFEPFLALRHLHRAKNESNPHYKWIDATIAAEWAVKEFLIRFIPDVEAILLEVPSPPLHKLYGSILESYTDQRSPKLKGLAEGEKIRNKLLHRPQDIHISLEQANEYVHDVEIAIYHLLTLLYPNDPIMKHFYKPRAVPI